jgi:RHS repeat-associated protein
MRFFSNTCYPHKSTAFLLSFFLLGFLFFLLESSDAAITQRLSVSISAEQGNGPSINPSMNANASLVLFESSADTLAAGESGGIYLRSTAFMNTRYVCPGTRPSISDGDQWFALIDDTGHVVRRTFTGNIVQQADAGLGGDFVGPPAISGDGRFVTFAANNTPGGTIMIYLYDGQEQTLAMVSQTTANGAADGDCDSPVINKDGTFVVFRSSAGNLVAGCAGGTQQIYLWNRYSGNFDLISKSAVSGNPAASDCSPPGISPSGYAVAFSCADDTLVAGDANGLADTFVLNYSTKEFWMAGRTQIVANGPSSMTLRPDVSEGGTVTAFVSSATNLVEEDTNAGEDIFLYDKEKDDIIRVNVASDGTPSYGGIGSLTLSGSGASLVYDTAAGDLVEQDTNGMADVFLWDADGLYNNPAGMGMAAAASSGGVSSVPGMGDAMTLGGSATGQYAVNKATLNFAMKRRLFKMAAVGPTIEINLYYNAATDQRVGDFGRGWTLENDLRVIQGKKKNEAILRKGDGSELVFTAGDEVDLGHCSTTLPEEGLKLSPPAGCQDTLSLTGNFSDSDSDTASAFYSAAWNYHEKKTRLDYWLGDFGMKGLFQLERVEDQYENGAFFARAYDYDDNYRVTGTRLHLISIANFSDPCSNGVCADNRVIEFFYGEPEGTDDLGKERCVKKIILPEGDTRSITLAHDDNFNLTQLVDMAGYTTDYTYDGDHYMTCALTQDGAKQKSVSFTWAPRGNGVGKRLASLNDGGAIVGFVASGTAVTETAPSGKKTAFASNSKGLITQVKDPLGFTTATTYNGSLPASITTARGTQMTYTYDDAGRIATRVVGAGTAKQTDFSFDYDEAGNMTAYTTPKGTWTFAYSDTATNSFGESKNTHYLTSVAAPALSSQATKPETRYTYGETGQISSVENAEGGIKKFTYDGHGNILSIEDEGAGLTSFVYDSLGRCTKITDANTHSKTLVYDDNDRLIQVTYDTAADTPAYTWNYDAFSVVSVTDENKHTTGVDRNVFGSITQKDLPAGNTIKYVYNDDNRRISVINGLGFAARTGYDAVGNSISELDPLDNLVQKEFDGEGNLTRVEDSLGNVTTMAYDVHNKQDKIVHADGREISYERDTTGHITLITNARSQTVTMAYDALGNMLSKQFSSGADNCLYEYDGVSNLTKAFAGGDTYYYTYSPTKNLLSIGLGVLTAGFGYDPVGNLTRVTYPGPVTADYTYDSYCRISIPSRFMDRLGDAVHTEKAKPNRVTRMTFASGKTITCAYDKAAQLTSMTRSNGTSTSFSYDANNRLTGIEHHGGGLPQLAYAYDDADRTTSIRVTNTALPAITAGITSGNYLHGQLTAWGGKSCAYDLDGNMTKAGDVLTGGTYTPENQLSSIKINGVLNTFEYDPNGFLKKKITGSEVTRYLYDRTGRLLVEASSSLGVRARYFYLGKTLAAMQRGGNLYYYHYDRTGNTLALTDSNGDVAATYAYEPYGLVTATGDIENPFTYCGAYGVMALDANLFHMKNRYYFAEAGRFMQRDPALFEAGNNLYDYGNGDPVSYIDPDGDFGFFAAAAAIGFGYSIYKGYKTAKKWKDKNMARFRKSQKGSEKDLINAELERKSYQQKANKEVTAAGASIWKNAAGAATGLSNDVMDTVEFSVEIHEDVTAEAEAEEEDAGWW